MLPLLFSSLSTEISQFWSWVVVSCSFMGLWLGGYVNFVEIFGFFCGCLLVVSGFLVTRWLFVVTYVNLLKFLCL